MVDKLCELLKHIFEMRAEKRWLNEIEIAIDRYKNAQSKANREYYTMKKLCERYAELYHRDLTGVKDGK